MIITPLSSATETHAAAQPTPAGSTVPATKAHAASTDTVTISSAAKASSSGTQAVQQEATETPAQTATEAAKGDPQAQKLLAKEAAAKAEYEKYSDRSVREARGGDDDTAFHVVANHRNPSRARGPAPSLSGENRLP